MFRLKITNVAQSDMKALVKCLLGLPGLDSSAVSKGLKSLPFELPLVEQEGQARQIQADIEKCGAVCVKSSAVHLKAKEKSHRELYMILGFSVLVVVGFGLSFHFSDDDPKKHIPQTQTPKDKTPPPPPKPSAEKPDKAPAAPAELPRIAKPKPSTDLKKDLHKNPYNPDTWKSLSENYERAGDTAAARKAKESYEKAIRTQKILSSMAKSFGNNIRAEVTEDAVYYRTNREFKSDEEFYNEASRLRDSLSVKFKGRKLIIENYATDGKVQRVELDP
jgi:hypothetical protein